MQSGLSLAVEEADARYKQLLAEVKYVEIGQQSQLKAAELEFLQAQVELKRSEANADRMLIKAPIEGLAVMSTFAAGANWFKSSRAISLCPA